MVTFALPSAGLPSILQEAMLRGPRRRPLILRAQTASTFSDNNYLAESGPPNWGKNRKGAGAPRGNRNAWLMGLTRLGIALLRLREQNRVKHLQLLGLQAKIELAEARLAAR
jgi:hypothetical protein